MPAALTYPGVYIEEIPSGVRTITGVATSITAFIGRRLRGPTDEPTTINNFGDYERSFGGLIATSTMSYAVRDFYLNGGSQAIIVRVHNRRAAKPRKASYPVTDLTLEAANPPVPGGTTSASRVDHETRRNRICVAERHGFNRLTSST